MSAQSSASPKAPQSLIESAVRFFGPGILVAVAFGYATIRVYDDLSERNDLFVAVLREQVSASKEIANAFAAFTVQLNKNTEELQKLSARIEKNP